MAKAYMLRHQIDGIVTSHVFVSEPSDAQLEPLRAELRARYGDTWKDKPIWTKVVEVELVGAGEIPDLTPEEPGEEVAKLPEYAISGTGFVKNP